MIGDCNACGSNLTVETCWTQQSDPIGEFSFLRKCKVCDVKVCISKDEYDYMDYHRNGIHGYRI